jgi:hypothetical protein
LYRLVTYNKCLKTSRVTKRSFGGYL